MLVSANSDEKNYFSLVVARTNTSLLNNDQKLTGVPYLPGNKLETNHANIK
jgi:hypothetical protein